VVGALGMWFLLVRTTSQVFANQYLVGVMDQANVALHIRAGKQLELLTTVEASLPSYVLAVDQEFRGHPTSTNALWMVRAYYERNQIGIPSQIRSILDLLPPKPPTACQIRLRALDRSVNTNSGAARRGRSCRLTLLPQRTRRLRLRAMRKVAGRAPLTIIDNVLCPFRTIEKWG